jgi:hypothetical protein
MPFKRIRLAIAAGVNNQQPEVQHLVPMLERIATSTGDLPKTMTFDAGYWSENNAKACSDQSIDTYIATHRLPTLRHCRRNAVHYPKLPTQKAARPVSSAAKGFQNLCPAQRNRGTGDRTDQGGPRPAALHETYH